MRRRLMMVAMIALMVSGSHLPDRALADTPAATQGSDAEITDRVVHALADAQGDVAGRIQVSTVNGVVTLEGSGLTSAQALKAVQGARQVGGVTEVRNRLKVRL